MSDEKRYVDILRVKGLGGIDGDYPFNLSGLVTIGDPDCMTNREGHRLKEMTGITAGSLVDALSSGDSDALLGIAVIVLARRGKRFDENVLWDAPIGAGFEFIADPQRELDEQEDEQGPPDLPQSAPGSSAPSETQPPSGGGSSSQPSDGPHGSDPSPTGGPTSDTSSTSDLPTSAT